MTNSRPQLLIKRMSALGQTGNTRREQMFSALALKADIAQCGRHVRFVPTAEVTNSIQLSHLQPPTNSVESGGSAYRYRACR
jgi:hypothetical protein